MYFVSLNQFSLGSVIGGTFCNFRVFVAFITDKIKFVRLLEAH